MFKHFTITLLSSCIISSLNALPPADDENAAKSLAVPYHTKVDAVDLPATPQNPFVSAEVFGFDSLKRAHLLSKSEQAEWENESKGCLRSVISTTDNQEKYRILSEGAQKGFPSSMLWLGKLEQDRKDLNSAFSWYALALWTQLIRGSSLESIKAVPFNPWKQLEELVQSSKSSLSQKNYFGFLRTTLPKVHPSLGKAQTFKDRIKNLLPVLGQSHAIDPLFDSKISAFTVNMAQWVSGQDTLYILGNEFSSKNKTQEAAYCYEVAAGTYRQSKTPDALYKLGNLIVEGHIKTALEGNLFQENERAEKAAEAYRQSKTPDALHNIGAFIWEGHIKTDLKGNPFQESERAEKAAEAYRQSKTPKGECNLGHLITAGHIKTDLKGNPFQESEKYEKAAEAYRQSKAPLALFSLGNLIVGGHIKTDLKGKPFQESEKYEKAAEAYRQSKAPEAVYILGIFIAEGHIKTDLKGNPFQEGERTKKAAEAYRQSKTPKAVLNLGSLIAAGHIKTDLEGKPFQESERAEKAAEAYRQSKIPDAVCNLGILIWKGHIKTDLKGNPFQENERDEKAAEAYRQSKTPTALLNLGSLIAAGHIKTDLKGNPFQEGERTKKAAEAYRQSKTPNALYNLAILELSAPSGQTLEGKKKALDLLLEASLAGIKRAHEHYLFLADIITQEEGKSLSASSQTAQTESKGKTPEQEESTLLSASEEAHPTPEKSIVLENVVQPPLPEEKPSHKQAEEDLSEDSSPQMQNWLKAEKMEKKQRKLQQSKEQLRKILNRTATSANIQSLLKTTPVSQKAQQMTKTLDITWSQKARKQYKYVSSELSKTIHKLIEDIKTGGRRGRPEMLTNGSYSRRITQEHRLVYTLSNKKVEILSCTGHYD